jgi:predicted kinase
MRLRTKDMATEPNAIRDEGSAKVIRLSRPSVVVLCGPAACGKSTFAAQHFRSTQIVSSDQARALVCDDERDQRFQTQAFTLLHCLIEQRLSINRLCVVDSTALTASARQSLLELARRYRVPAVVLLLDVPLETCLEHDVKRERSVGRQVIERQHQLFEQAKSAIKQEGFEQVFELGGEDLDKVQIEIVFRPVPRAVTEGAPPERQRAGPPRSQSPAATNSSTRDVKPPSPPNRRPPG